MLRSREVDWVRFSRPLSSYRNFEFAGCTFLKALRRLAPPVVPVLVVLTIRTGESQMFLLVFRAWSRLSDCLVCGGNCPDSVLALLLSGPSGCGVRIVR